MWKTNLKVLKEKYNCDHFTSEYKEKILLDFDKQHVKAVKAYDLGITKLADSFFNGEKPSLKIDQYSQCAEDIERKILLREQKEKRMTPTQLFWNVVYNMLTFRGCCTTAQYARKQVNRLQNSYVSVIAQFIFHHTWSKINPINVNCLDGLTQPLYLKIMEQFLEKFDTHPPIHDQKQQVFDALFAKLDGQMKKTLFNHLVENRTLQKYLLLSRKDDSIFLWKIFFNITANNKAARIELLEQMAKNGFGVISTTDGNKEPTPVQVFMAEILIHCFNDCISEIRSSQRLQDINNFAGLVPVIYHSKNTYYTASTADETIAFQEKIKNFTKTYTVPTPK